MRPLDLAKEIGIKIVKGSADWPDKNMIVVQSNFHQTQSLRIRFMKFLPAMLDNKRKIAVLAFAMVVVTIGYGIITPIMPFYVKQLGASGNILGLLAALYGFMIFLFAPMWGNISERHGRKHLLILGAIGAGLMMLMMGLSVHIWMLFAARALGGALAAATTPVAFSYICDSTTSQERSQGMGILIASTGLGLILGPGLGGLLVEYSYQTPFFTAAGLCGLSALLLVLIPESLPPESRLVVRHKSNCSLAYGVKIALFSSMGILLWIAFLANFGSMAFYSIYGLYIIERFQYTPALVGTVLTVAGVITAIAQGVMIGPLVKRFGEIMVVKVTLAAEAIGLVLLTIVHSLGTVLLATSFFIMSTALLTPAISALASKSTAAKAGVTMGLCTSFFSLGRIAGPILAGALIDIHLDLPFLLCAAIILVGFAASLIWLKQAEPA